MRFEVDRKEFEVALRDAARVAKMDKQGIFQDVALSARDGRVSVYTTNGEIQVEHFLSADVMEDGQEELPSLSLHKIVKAWRGDRVKVNVDLRSGGDLKAEVSCGAGKAKLSVGYGNRIGSMAATKGEAVYDLDLESFKTAFAAASMVSASAKLADGRVDELHAICLHREDERWLMVGTDRHRLTVESFQCAQEWPSGVRHGALVDSAMAGFIAALEGDEAKISIGESSVIIQSGTVELALQTVHGSFPDYTQILPTSERILGAVDFGAGDIAGASKRCEQLGSDEKAMAIEVFDDGRCRVGSDGDGSSYGEDVPTSHFDGDPVRVGVNAKYVCDAVKGLKEARLSYGHSLQPVLITEAGQDYPKRVVMPMRLE